MATVMSESMLPSIPFTPPRRMKITDVTGVWFASSFGPGNYKLTHEAYAKWLTRRAIKQGVKALYEPATEEEYQAYKAQMRAEVAK